MSEIEKIQRYIEKTKLDKESKYSLNITEGFSLAHMAHEMDELPPEETCVAMNHGKAKGNGAAEAEVRVRLQKKRMLCLRE